MAKLKGWRCRRWHCGIEQVRQKKKVKLTLVKTESERKSYKIKITKRHVRTWCTTKIRQTRQDILRALGLSGIDLQGPFPRVSFLALKECVYLS